MLQFICENKRILWAILDNWPLYHILYLPLLYLLVKDKLKKRLSWLLMIYGYNLNLILLLLQKILIYHVKNYNINLKKTYPRLNPRNKIKNFSKFMKKQFVSFLIILI